MKVTAIIVNYKGAKNTIECIESLQQSNLPKNHSLHIVVIENNSQDDSESKLKKIKNIKLIPSHQNLGYTGGNNLGIKYALNNGTDYVLILNNDTVLQKSALLNLLNPQGAQIISPKIYFAPGFEYHKNRYKKADIGRVIWYAGGQIDWNNIIGMHRGVNEVDRGQFEKVIEIEYATGACLLINCEIFKTTGFFDDKYFLYLEDIDFSVRAKKKGFKIIYQPKSVVWHKNAASSGGSGSDLQDYYITRNRLLFAFKFAKLQTKLALLKQVIKQSNNPIRRQALLDFLTFRFGRNDTFT